MHALVETYHITRREFERNLVGLQEEDARKPIGPMNCISWIIGHAAHQQYTFFVDWAQGRGPDPRFQAYGTGNPASGPPLAVAMSLWQIACNEADVFLDSATDESLRIVYENNENGGTLLVRSAFHIWCHLGEISAIRQILGHKPPEFVDMHRWAYGG